MAVKEAPKKIPATEVVDEYTTIRVKISTAKRVRIFAAHNDCKTLDDAICEKFPDGE